MEKTTNLYTDENLAGRRKGNKKTNRTMRERPGDSETEVEIPTSLRQREALGTVSQAGGTACTQAAQQGTAWRARVAEERPLRQALGTWVGPVAGQRAAAGRAGMCFGGDAEPTLRSNVVEEGDRGSKEGAEVLSSCRWLWVWLRNIAEDEYGTEVRHKALN